MVTIKHFGSDHIDFSIAHQIARCNIDVFATDPLFSYIAGPKYASALTTKTGPLYNELCKGWAWLFYSWAKRQPGTHAYLIYDDQQDSASGAEQRLDSDGGADQDDQRQLVGFAFWIYPAYMTRRSERSDLSGRIKGLLDSMRRYVVGIYALLMSNYWMGLREGTLLNPRLHRYFADRGLFARQVNERPSEDLPTMSWDQLSRTLYPLKHYVMLESFGIRPQFRGKGYASKLLKYSIAQIPNVNVIFKSRGKAAEGPQKLCLNATAAGKPVYLKHGFRAVEHEFLVEYKDAAPISSTFMVLNRDTKPLQIVAR